MKLLSSAIIGLLFSLRISAQDINKIINDADVLRIEKTLSADDMKGRKPGSAEIKKAASFIADEFSKAGLVHMPGSNSYLQEFSMARTKLISANGSVDGKPIQSGRIIAMSPDTAFTVTETSGYEMIHIAAGANLGTEIQKILKNPKKYIVIMDTAFSGNFKRLGRIGREIMMTTPSTIFVLAEAKPTTYSISVSQEITELKLSNVVGYLPGKSKPDELVIFSGHYDHIGIGKPNAQNDSIFNGANDDASGITAVIMLSKYFSKIKDNERTLVFAAFTAEESGGYGSKFFSKSIDPAKAIAMFNIEMIGTESKWGTNSTYITGFEKSDLGTILQKNLEGSVFKFYPDPYPAQQLFYRSDNATLAELGVPAHTVSTSKMDAEPYYHSADDEIETLDLQNMAEIIKSIAMSSKSIVKGKDTPSRVKVEN